MRNNNHGPQLLTIIITIFLIGYFLEIFKVGNTLLRDYFQISTELLPLVLSFSIFVMTLIVYEKHKDNHSFFLGWAFFVIGLLDLYHILSYPFMPDFINPNSSHKSDIFWIEARVLASVLFLASVYVYSDTHLWLHNKSYLFASVWVFSFASLATGIYPEYFPEIRTPDGNPTKITLLLLIIASLILLYASYLYAIRLQKTGQKYLLCLLYGFILIVSSNFVYLFYDYPGHLLKASAYYFLYLGIFKSTVEQPYQKLVETDEKRIHEAEERYRYLFNNANDAILTTDLEYRITSWNFSAEKIFGWTANEVMGMKLSTLLFVPAMVEEEEKIIRNAMLGEAFPGIETVLMRKNGTTINVSMTLSPVRDQNQNVIGMSGIIRDNTERKRAEEQTKSSLKEKEILLREIHHRVKNNMQIISSLLKLQSVYSKDKKYVDIYKESQNRITAMSLIHEKLYQSRDFTKIDLKGYIKELVTGLIQSYEANPGRITLNINVEDIPLSINTAIPCGLLINELVSNSLKYAFPEGKPGEIKISLRSIGENKLELLVSDNGVGIPGNVDFKKSESWGWRLITLLAENQLHGEINLNRNKGTEFQIIFRDVR